MCAHLWCKKRSPVSFAGAVPAADPGTSVEIGARADWMKLLCRSPWLSASRSTRFGRTTSCFGLRLGVCATQMNLLLCYIALKSGLIAPISMLD